MKINNLDWKFGVVFCSCLCISVMLTFGIILIIYDSLIVGCLLILFGLLSGIIIYVLYWPETIVIDNEKIIVYRWGKEVNQISWTVVKEIYRKEIFSKYRLTCYYYFSDGEDGLLQGKKGNEHFVVFRSLKEKEIIFSKFTDIPIQDMENNK